MEGSRLSLSSVHRRPLKLLAHASAVVLLTALTQVGGLAWFISRFFKRHILAFALTYAALSLLALWLAPMWGRVPLSCSGDGPLRVGSWFYCLTNRNYVAPEMKAVLADLATAVDARFPSTETLVLDANFPFADGFPLLPHLSHNDGEKADIAFYYRDEQGYRRAATPSPLGYFAFENGPSECPPAWLTLRWNLRYLQPLWRDLALEPERTRYAAQWLAAEPRIGKLFLEPHLKRELRFDEPKIRFQGCRAARHDDHLHLQL